MAHITAFSTQVSHLVATRLAAAGISQRTVSERTGIPNATLSRRLGGHSPLNMAELSAIAELLDTTPADLLAAADATEVAS